ncbi:XrtA/PEP-CTERM system amidotransferase [Massilia psychrophila]|uniref:asparagine synthase (glutamine-hydrolyzing) n=1 Tax=Massilia psychrophila TaxID=1603353 RepID=A0A2G8T046_9BURK|nr:XrtA/PEP-CTERM system amidotransferase [Massilia psychrophila]PIL39391.1 asparagine synthetase B [Massilia psychrophila]GGE87015.1 amidotransferase 1, exosortase A system-associated [Massilia psychrophila]
MCGIVGIFDTRGARPVDPALLKRMNETQHHRGPDEGDIYTEPGVGFGHRRLSVIDIASGQQPMFNAAGDVGVVFNGEIYNFPELTAQLEQLGYVFRTKSDTETIVHAWQAWGEDCVHKLRGMFALCIWDRNKQTMFMARDRLGVKPFYYALLADGMFIFGSELKSLRAHPGLPHAIDPQAVEDYFAYGYVPEPKTIYAGAKKLSPGFTLTVRIGQPVPQPKQFWDVPFKLHAPMSQQDAEGELIERLRDAVKIRLKAEVPLGAFLSGGVDSSAIVAMMAGLMKDPVNTCSIAFQEKAFDESPYAEQVARQYKTEHVTETVDTDDYALLDTLADLYDEPYADSSAIPTYRVCQLARKRVTVALSGDGGDENLAGYRRYRYAMAEDAVRSKIPAGLRKLVFGPLGKYYPKADWAPRVLRAKTTFEALSRDLVEGYFHGVSIMSDDMRAQLFSDKFRKNLQGYRAIDVMQGHAANSPTDDPLSMIQYLDMKTYLPGDILTKVDRASMAHALEVRVPLLDHKLVEWISGLPPSMKLNGSEGKYIFKKSLESYLPEEILYRKKMGFAVPLATWFRGPLRQRVRESLLGDTLASTGIFNTGYLAQMVEQHESGRRDYSAPIWTVLMFEAFLRKELQGESA